MTRAFFLMCLSFACLIAPFPRFRSPGAMLAYETLYSGITLFLPALLVHFFALFPDSTRLRGVLMRITRIAYGVERRLVQHRGAARDRAAAGASCARSREGAAAEHGGAVVRRSARWSRSRCSCARTCWRAARTLAGGCASRWPERVLGFLPLTALVLLRNLFPGVSLPAERGVGDAHAAGAGFVRVGRRRVPRVRGAHGAARGGRARVPAGDVGRGVRARRMAGGRLAAGPRAWHRRRRARVRGVHLRRSPARPRARCASSASGIVPDASRSLAVRDSRIARRTCATPRSTRCTPRRARRSRNGCASMAAPRSISPAVRRVSRRAPGARARRGSIRRRATQLRALRGARACRSDAAPLESATRSRRSRPPA